MSQANMMKVPISELPELLRLLAEVGAVTKGDTEDREAFLKFKYAVGRNWDRVKSAWEPENKWAETMLSNAQEHKEYQDFQAARTDLCLMYCRRDDKDQPITHQDANGLEVYEFTPEGRQQFNDKLAALKARYADAIERMEYAQQSVEDRWKTEVEIEIYKVPFRTAPERLSGAFLHAIAWMLEGCPEVSN